MHDKPLLNAAELSGRLNLPKSTIYKMAAKGLIPSVSVGLKLTGRRFIEHDVREALAKLVQPPRPYHPPREQQVAEVVEP